MKLSDIVEPLEPPYHTIFSSGAEPTNFNILQHLLLLVNREQTNNPGSWKRGDLYNEIAHKLIDVFCPSDLPAKSRKSFLNAIVKKITKIELQRQKLTRTSIKKTKDYKDIITKIFLIPKVKRRDGLQNPEEPETPDQAMVFFNEGTMSSCQSIPDNTLADPDFIISPEKSALKLKERTITIRDSGLFGNKVTSVNLEDLGDEFARNVAGSESKARLLNKYTRILEKKFNLPLANVCVTRNTVESAIKKDGTSRQSALSTHRPQGLFFDAKKSIVRIDSNGTSEKKSVNHYTVVSHPEKKYLGFYECDGTGLGTASALVNFLETNEIQCDDLVCCGGDNTASNTGHLTGAFASLEKIVKKPLQRSCCLIHLVEVILKEIFNRYDGVPCGPGEYRGSIGKLLMTDVWKLRVKQFDLIHLNFDEFPEKVVKSMSNDRQLLYKLVVGVAKGDINHVCHRTIGRVHQARWLTLGSRIVRLYCSQPDDLTLEELKKLKILTRFISRVYFKIFSDIKYRPTLIDGPRHLFTMITLARNELGEEDRKVAFHHIQLNGFFAHPENVLLAMAGDDDINTRARAVQLLLRLHDKREYVKMMNRMSSDLFVPKNPVRTFYIPSIKFDDCTDYTSMVRFNTMETTGPYSPPRTWFYKVFIANYKGRNKTAEVTFPPMLSHLDTAEKIEELIDYKFQNKIECHTQSVERLVALTAQCCKRRRTEDTQQRLALSTDHAQSAEPSSKRITLKGYSLKKQQLL